MAMIRIYSPCHHIHRIILPPDSRHLIHHPFIGGALVMAKVLWMLKPGNEPVPSEWDEEINKISQSKFPDRFIHISRFCPAPAQRKDLLADRMFLRVRRTEDGENFDKDIQYTPFTITGGVRKVVVIGGVKDTEWPNDFENEEVCYLIPKSFKDAKNMLDHVRGKNQQCRIVCQMDATQLDKDFPIQMDSSYERTVGDICRSRHPGKEIDKKQVEYGRLIDHVTRAGYDSFDHLIVRIGNAACLMISKAPVQAAGNSKAPDPLVTLFHHPHRSAPTRYPSLGDMLAYDLLMASAFVHQISQCDDLAQLRDSLCAGAKVAVQASYACFLNGFGEVDAKAPVKADHFHQEVLAEKLFHRFIENAIAIERAKLEDVVRTMASEVDYSKAVSPNVFWRMAFKKSAASPQSGGGVGSKEESEESSDEKSCLTMATNYLVSQTKKLPLVKIGKLSLVDRHEVEDYLFLQNLLLDYHGDDERKKPLSIGVFGQPGSGKSFGVKQLVAEMSGDGSTFAKEAITINLSQMRTLNELTECFHRIRDACLSTPIPLVFFDEFDSSLDGTAFGWLKYFLAPMQDSEFIENGQAYHFGKAIFVFAGGVNHSFSEFNERSRNPDFCDAKGPDFISRLRGILNIRSMNKPEGDGIEHLYMLRRAVFLRESLEKRIGRDPTPLIDNGLAKALLSIPWFKHGVRSVEAILDMSHIRRGEAFSLGQLPPRDQLDMHVDARAFLALAGLGSTKDKA